MLSHESVVLYAEFTVLPGEEDQVESLVRGLTGQVREEPGNVMFLVHCERDNPRQYFIYEEYADEEAFSAHLRYDHGVLFNRALAPLVLDGRATVTLLKKF